jgi:hypothetical protein
MPKEPSRDQDPKKGASKKPILNNPKKPGDEPGNTFGQSVEAGGSD